MQKWEYLYIEPSGNMVSVNDKPLDQKSPRPIHELLDEYGQQGWELVAVPYTEAYGHAGMSMIFKRLKS